MLVVDEILKAISFQFLKVKVKLQRQKTKFLKVNLR